MRVLSLFDGISVGRLALDRAGLPISSYLASEICPYSITLTARNWPDVRQIGDVHGVRDVRDVDLLLGGSPCQGFSLAGDGLNFDDPRSGLFFEFVRVLEDCKPTYFLFENVMMPQWCIDVISSYLGVWPRLFCASEVSWQSRPRLWWSNVELGLVNVNGRGAHPLRGDGVYAAVRGRGGRQMLECRADKLCNCLTTVEKDSVVSRDYYLQRVLASSVPYRNLTWDERENLMGLPAGYTYLPYGTGRVAALGNAWHGDVATQLIGGMFNDIR